MKKKRLKLAGALILASIAPAAGCTSTSSSTSTTGGQGTTASGGSGSGTTQSTSTSAGDSTSGSGTPTSTSGAATTGGGIIPVDCGGATACGGDLVGTWVVTSSCLEISGDLDVFQTSLACATVPATGSLQTTGTFTANADGTYEDNTVTTGNVSFPLDASCLSISGVAVECDRVGSIFMAVGWTEATCAETDGQCACELTTEQMAGLGAVLPYTDATGSYTTSDSSLTIAPGEYTYCAMGDSLTVQPQMAALTGSIVLQREGTLGPTTTSSSSSTTSTSAGGASTSAGGAGSTTDGQNTSDATTGSGGSGGNPTTTPKPCDIYAEAGTECVAAHSTVRALFSSFDGALYQVKRNDGMTQDIPVKSPGGYADSSVQDDFCGGSSCTIWMVYDQTGNGNFIEATTMQSSVATTMNGSMSAANASQEQLTVSGNQVYSLFTRPSQAYWNDGSENGMPLGAEPQGVYMVTSGTHFNSGCCYNYGNAQLDRNYHGGPTMDSVYFGNNTIWGTGAGNGPWVMADMEDGMLAWGNGGNNPNSLSLPYPYVTAMEKNDGTSTFALKGGDATDPGGLTTMWDGALPGSKSPMRKEGAVILGAGGDCCYSNNNASEGTFYEGAIVSGYPSDETDDAIHANIVEAGYGQ